MEIKLGHGDVVAHVLVRVLCRAEVRLVRLGQGRFAFLVGEEVEDVEARVVLEEVFAVAEEGGEGSLDRASDGDLLVERLTSAFFPKHCAQERARVSTLPRTCGSLVDSKAKKHVRLTRDAPPSLHIREAEVFRPQDRLGLDKVGDRAVIVDAANVEPGSAPLPTQSADQAEDDRFASDVDIVRADVTLDGEDHEALLVKDGSHVGRERGSEREERSDQVGVPEETAVVVNLGFFVPVRVQLGIHAIGRARVGSLPFCSLLKPCL